MSAMQERGRDWWRSYFRVHFPEAKGTDDAVDEILSFAAEREDKARREAVVDLQDAITRWEGGEYSTGECLSRLVAKIRALLQSPATDAVDDCPLRCKNLRRCK